MIPCCRALFLARLPRLLAAACVLGWLAAACAESNAAVATEPPGLTPVIMATVAPTTLPTETPLPTAAPSPTATVPPSPTTAPTPLPTEAPAGTGAFNPEAYQWVEVVSGLGDPISMAHAGDGSSRLFVNEQAGTIRIIQDRQLLPASFLDISARVGSGALEQGLLGTAFHPDYKRNGFFYVNYTDVNGDTVVARYSVSPNDPNAADPDSEVVMLRVDQPYPNHNGGQLQFGPDGMLYIGLGDGGAAGDPHGNGQNLSVLLGKLLRVDVKADEPYAIPPDNPFVGDPDARPEIWAYGLRNPWRFSFDRATGDLYIADVGQAKIEEVDFQPADSPGGENYGWDLMEGSQPYEGGPQSGLVEPVAEYSHEFGCSITGGYVYRGATLPELNGVYFYGDWCSGFVWALARGADGGWASRLVYRTGFNISAFGEDEAGELYVLDQSGGAVYRLEAAP